MERRNFIKAAILSSIAGAIELKSSNLFAKESVVASKENDLVAVMGGEPEAMYKKAIQAMGGMSTFVKRGQKVVVKPNIGWDKKPELSEILILFLLLQL